MRDAAKRQRRKRDRAWYYAAHVIPTPIAQRLPEFVRTFIWRRAVRGV